MTAVAASVCYGTGSVLQAVGSRRSARGEAAAKSTTSTTSHGGPSLVSTAKAAVTWEFLVAGRRGGTRGKRPHPTSTHWWPLAASALVIGGGIVGVRWLGAKAAILAGLLSGLGFGAVGVGVRVLNGADPIAPGALLIDPALYAILTGGAGGMYLHTVALQIGSVNGAEHGFSVASKVQFGAVLIIRRRLSAQSKRLAIEMIHVDALSVKGISPDRGPASSPICGPLSVRQETPALHRRRPRERSGAELVRSIRATACTSSGRRMGVLLLRHRR
ncbi:MAG TPA: hypothetical protein VE198_22945 [Actinoallomurus sp.]|nr:hypothetical protein [Actinoallomurus sp.]